MIRFDVPTINGDTDLLGRFWCAALGLVELEREDGNRWVLLGTTSGMRVLGLQSGMAQVGGIHLDLACDSEEFASQRLRLLSLGATEMRSARNEQYGSIANFADPHGNLFDLCAYKLPR